MGLPRQRADTVASALALAALVAAAFGFAVAHNGAALVMSAICIAGLCLGRLAGISGVVILAVALGLVAILWMVWVDPLSTPRRTNAAAHFGGGLLAGWAIATTLLRRGRLRRPLMLAALGVLALTVGWELSELVGDRILDTALIPSWRDSAHDIFFGCFGGAVGIGAARVLAGSTDPSPPPGR